MTTPFEALRQPVAPLAPRPEFAAELRRRVEAALGRSPDGAGGTTTVTAYLCARDAARAIEFYEAAFGARLRGEPIVMPDGRIGHAELEIGDTVVMLADEYPEEGVLSPLTTGGTSVQLMLHVDDPDAVFERALAQGATAWRPVADTEYGRSGKLRDPFGHNWFVTTPSVPARREGGLGYYTLEVPDLARAQAFWGALLGWAFQGGVEQGAHVLDSDPPGGLHGGHATARTVPYFRVADAEAAAARVRELGGRVEEAALYPSGRDIACEDDQGLPFHLWEAAPGY
ncbi:MAG TPA: VOC family protein [Acidimicrobiales bacterium]|nr:VOC family protein [Acidimicrobiales bacterium]